LHFYRETWRRLSGLRRVMWLIEFTREFISLVFLCA
jgi:hypothetical protein